MQATLVAYVLSAGCPSEFTGTRDFGYNDKVLVGNWLDRRAQVLPSSDTCLRTSYEEDYRTSPGSDPNGFSEIWYNRTLAQVSEEFSVLD